MTRLEDLKKAREGLLERMGTCENDQTYAVLVRTLVDVVKQIEEIEPAVEKEATGLDEFTRRLQERQSNTKTSRSTKQAQ